MSKKEWNLYVAEQRKAFRESIDEQVEARAMKYYHEALEQQDEDDFECPDELHLRMSEKAYNEIMEERKNCSK